jgi:hypothetical protein
MKNWTVHTLRKKGSVWPRLVVLDQRSGFEDGVAALVPLVLGDDRVSIFDIGR